MEMRQYILNIEQAEKLLDGIIKNEIGSEKRDGKTAFVLYSQDSLSRIRYMIEEEEGIFSLYAWAKEENPEEMLKSSALLLEQIAGFKFPEPIEHEIPI